MRPRAPCNDWGALGGSGPRTLPREGSPGGVQPSEHVAYGEGAWAPRALVSYKKLVGALSRLADDAVVPEKAMGMSHPSFPTVGGSTGAGKEERMSS